MIQKTFFTFLCLSWVHLLSGQPISEWKYDELEKRIAQGKDTTYIINFWATWCKPCVAELPHFEALKQDLAGQKVQIILMSVDFPKEKESRLIPFLADRNLTNEIGLWMETNENVWIDKVAKEWSGSLPGTWVRKVGSNHRKFYEKSFHSLEELKNILPE